MKKTITALVATPLKVYDAVHEITYWVELRTVVPAQGQGVSGYSTEYAGKNRVKSKVRVVIDISSVAQALGKKAHTNRSKKSVDGDITVIAIGLPVVLEHVPAPEKEDARVPSDVEY